MVKSLLLIVCSLALVGGCGDGGDGGAGRGGGGGNGGLGGMSGGGSGGGGGGGLGGAAGTPPNGIVVDTASGRLASDSVDGACDILEAVTAASVGQSYHECANPTGLKRIILTAGRTYPTKKTLRLDDGVQVGIADGTTGKATIAAAAGWFTDPGDPATGCLVHAAGGTTTIGLTDVTLSQEPTLALAGACVTRGFLELRRARVTGFRASGVVATCLPRSGCDHETNGDEATTLRVLASLVDGNTSAGNGGGIFSEGSGAVVLIAHSAIVGNVSDAGGGGAYFGGGWATDIIDSSTISGNSASFGGGVLVKFANCTNTYLNVFNSTITDNTANGSGGGIQFEAAEHACSTQDVSVFASIVTGNRSTGTSESNINADWNGGLFNCVRGSFIYVAPGYPLPSQSGVPCRFDLRDARLAALTPMGGAGDLPVHPLRADSPAIDAATDDLTADQQRDAWIAIVDSPPPPDWTLFDRVVDGDGDGTADRDLGAVERNERWQTELLAVAAKGAAAHGVVTTPDGWDRGAGTAYAAAGATNEFVTYLVPIAEAARHDVTVGVRKAPDAGQFQLAIASSAAGPWTDLGPPQDGYAASAAFAALGPFPTPIFAAAGEKLVRFTVVGKNAASAGHGLFLDYIDARRSTAPCAVRQIAVGAYHTCALTTAGGVRCWGDNTRGQLGDGSTTARTTPPATDALTGVAAIAAGALHTCALTTAGGVRCWGDNSRGQNGDGWTIARNAPPATDVLTGVKAIAAGGAHTCALMTASGGVRCWGGNTDGQLGDGSMTDRLTPPTVDVLTGAKAITAGGAHTCAVVPGAGVRCWGLNVVGQLGDGTTTDRATPPATDAITNVMAVSAGSRHTCAVTAAGGVRCWGRNADAELGDGTYTEAWSPPATDVLAGARDVAAGLNFTCALTAAGGVRCWGYNSDGQIGDETELAVDRMAPAATDVLTGAQAIGVGFAHTCALMTGGGVRCWGANAVGQLGDGLTPELQATPPVLDAPGFIGTCP